MTAEEAAAAAAEPETAEAAEPEGAEQLEEAAEAAPPAPARVFTAIDGREFESRWECIQHNETRAGRPACERTPPE